MGVEEDPRGVPVCRSTATGAGSPLARRPHASSAMLRSKSPSALSRRRVSPRWNDHPGRPSSSQEDVIMLDGRRSHQLRVVFGDGVHVPKAPPTLANRQVTVFLMLIAKPGVGCFPFVCGLAGSTQPTIKEGGVAGRVRPLARGVCLRRFWWRHLRLQDG